MTQNLPYKDSIETVLKQQTNWELLMKLNMTLNHINML